MLANCTAALCTLALVLGLQAWMSARRWRRTRTGTTRGASAWR